MKAIPFIAILALLCQSVSAKRVDPPNVPPVTFHGVTYTAPPFPDDWPSMTFGGVIEAQDSATGKVIGRYQIYKNYRVPILEGDVQDVFIREMRLDSNSKTLFLLDERDNAYTFDLEHHRLVGGHGLIVQYGWIASMILVIGLAFLMRKQWKEEFLLDWADPRPKRT